MGTGKTERVIKSALDRLQEAGGSVGFLVEESTTRLCPSYRNVNQQRCPLHTK